MSNCPKVYKLFGLESRQNFYKLKTVVINGGITMEWKQKLYKITQGMDWVDKLLVIILVALLILGGIGAVFEKQGETRTTPSNPINVDVISTFNITLSKISLVSNSNYTVGKPISYTGHFGHASCYECLVNAESPIALDIGKTLRFYIPNTKIIYPVEESYLIFTYCEWICHFTMHFGLLAYNYNNKLIKSANIVKIPYIEPGYEKLSSDLYRVWWTNVSINKKSLSVVLVIQNVSSTNETEAKKYVESHRLQINQKVLNKYKLLKIYNYTTKKILTIKITNFSSINYMTTIPLNPAPSIKYLKPMNNSIIINANNSDVTISDYIIITNPDKVFENSIHNTGEYLKKGDTIIRTWYPNIVLVNDMHTYTMYILNESVFTYNSRYVANRNYFEISALDYTINNNTIEVFRKELDAVLVRTGKS